MIKHKQYWTMGMIFIACLFFSSVVFAQSTPLAVEGIVYLSDGVTQAPAGTQITITNLNNGFSVSGGSGTTYNTGRYAAAVDGNAGDTVLISASDGIAQANLTVSLTGSLHNLNIVLNSTGQPPAQCNTGETRACSLQSGVCTGMQEVCTNGQWPGCNYSSDPRYEMNELTCDHWDNDCDNVTDEYCIGIGQDGLNFNISLTNLTPAAASFVDFSVQGPPHDDLTVVCFVGDLVNPFHYVTNSSVWRINTTSMYVVYDRQHDDLVESQTYQMFDRPNWSFGAECIVQNQSGEYVSYIDGFTIHVQDKEGGGQEGLSFDRSVPLMYDPGRKETEKLVTRTRALPNDEGAFENAVELPYYVVGTVYKSRKKEVDEGTPITIVNEDTGESIALHTGIGPMNGTYAVIIPGSKGDEVSVVVNNDERSTHTFVLEEKKEQQADFKKRTFRKSYAPYKKHKIWLIEVIKNIFNW